MRWRLPGATLQRRGRRLQRAPGTSSPPTPTSTSLPVHVVVLLLSSVVAGSELRPRTRMWGPALDYRLRRGQRPHCPASSNSKRAVRRRSVKRSDFSTGLQCAHSVLGAHDCVHSLVEDLCVRYVEGCRCARAPAPSRIACLLDRPPWVVCVWTRSQSACETSR